MRSGNTGLIAAGVVIAWLVWIVFDMSMPARVSPGLGGLDFIQTSSVPVLVEFHADWCGPCKMVGPVVEELTSELGSRARVHRVDIDQEPAVAKSQNVRSIPTFVAFRDGKETGRASGVITKEQMKALLGL